ncbi:MAG: hypothetical protein LQ339_008103 [Xanthoria mediterranea]|nr:MAG: hypothetical protein LQ339_008103 [Xanthoria mediterranea]
MEVGREDSEMLLGPVETYPDALPAQETSTNEDVVPRRLSGTSSGGGITNNTPIESNNPATSASRRRAADPEIIQKVEAVVQQIVRSLQQEEGKVWISLRSRKRPGTSPSAQSSRSPAQDQYKLSFPGDTPEEAWRFTVVLRILELIHETLVNDAVVSKRNIYYKDPELFKSQKVVDRYVDVLSHTFGIQRAALNVTAAAKGLVAGSFTMTFHDSSTRSCNGAANAILIDDVDDIRSVDISNVLWILVVEKESTFRTLDSCKTHENSRAGKGIILTAKGYPDVSTRVFLRLLSISSHPLPSIYALVDFDPDGISIMSTYKHGSANLAHENANVRCSTLRWLGVKSGDLNIATSNTGLSDDDADDIKGLLRLSKRDRKKAVGMLGQGICDEHGVEQEWRRELQVMLMVSLKAEMEILSQRPGGIERWVEDRLCEEMS